MCVSVVWEEDLYLPTHFVGEYNSIVGDGEGGTSVERECVTVELHWNICQL